MSRRIEVGGRQGRGNPAAALRAVSLPDTIVMHVLGTTASAGARWRLSEEAQRWRREWGAWAIARALVLLRFTTAPRRAAA